jgi:hypothetical protein
VSGILSAIGKFGKGFGTVAGVLVSLTGLLTGGGANLQNCVNYVTKQPNSAVLIAGILITAFGIGRKAGWVGGGGK